MQRSFVPSRMARAFGLAALLCCASVRADEAAEINKLLRSGQLPAALTRVDVALAQHPKDAQFRFLKGMILSEQGRSAEAIVVFQKLTEDFPELPEPYNNLAVLYAGSGQYDKARVALERAIRTNPAYATAHENLGDVYAKLASQSYDKAMQLLDSPASTPPPKSKLAMVRTLKTPASQANAPAAASAASAAAAAPSAPAPASASSATARASALASAPAAAYAPAPVQAATTPSPASAPAAAPRPTPTISVPVAGHAPAATVAAAMPPVPRPTPAAVAPKPAAPAAAPAPTVAAAMQAAPQPTSAAVAAKTAAPAAAAAPTVATAMPPASRLTPAAVVGKPALPAAATAPAVAAAMPTAPAPRPAPAAVAPKPAAPAAAPAPTVAAAMPAGATPAATMAAAPRKAAPATVATATEAVAAKPGVPAAAQNTALLAAATPNKPAAQAANTSPPKAAVSAQPAPELVHVKPPQAMPAASAPAVQLAKAEPAKTDSGEKDDVSKAVDQWAKAWSAQDMKAYLAAYGSNFQTPRGQNRKAWEADRSARIEGKEHIKVTVEAPQITVSGSTATVKFRQLYVSDKLKANSRKTLVMEKHGGKWLIKQEQSGG
jgi:colicin import membrane protein